METPRVSKAQNPSCEQRLSIHMGSLDALISFLLKHNAEEVCLKSVLSPTFSLQGDSLRHAGVCVTACLSAQPGIPIVYATFLAGSGAWGGKHARLLYPKLATVDPLRLLSAQEAIEHVQHVLFFTVQQSLQSISSLSVVIDAQWDVKDVWSGMAKGFVWQDGVWLRQPSSPSSLFSIS